MTTITLSRLRHRLLTDCLAERAKPIARSRRFAIYDIADRPSGSAAADPMDIVLVHDITRAEIDNNIAAYVADELLPLLDASRRSGIIGNGATAQELFERFVGEIVRSMDASERRAWHLYYDNTLAALRHAVQPGGRTDGCAAPTDFIADFGAIYRHVNRLIAEVVPETVIDVATCFGFLPILLATADRPHARPRRIVACDINPALVSLAEDYAQERGLADVQFVQADLLAPGIACQLAPAKPPFDVVTAIHLLEHLGPDEIGPAMDTLWSLTRHRLIVAVPVEAIPDPRFGHRQIFSRESLAALGHGRGSRCRSFEDHGAWLVIDRARQAGAQAKRVA